MIGKMLKTIVVGLQTLHKSILGRSVVEYKA